MANTRKLTVEIAGETTGLSRALGSADKQASTLGSKLAKFGKVAAVGLAAGAVGAVALGKSFVDAAIESQKVTKQTEAVIKSMGGASKVTAQQVADLSTKLSMKTGVDDELIQSGSNVLLTFGKIRNEVGKGNAIFDRATTAALDMSVALGTDMKAATIQVGKALNDPIKGITALQKAGVSFTDDQKKRIKWLVENNRTLDAQKIILGELDKQFGGSAAAQATAGDKLKVVWGNLQEQLGEKLLPIVEKVASFLAKNLPGAMEAVGRVVGPIAEKIGEFWNALTSGFTEDEGTRIERIALAIRAGFQKLAEFVTTKLLPAMQDIGAWFVANKPVLIGVAAAIATGLVAAFVSWAVAAGTAAIATIAAAAPIIALAAAIGVLVAGVIYAYNHWGWFKDAVDAVASFITGTLWPVLQSLAGWFTNTLVPAIAGAIGWIRDNWQLLLGILTGPIGTAVYIITTHWNTIKSGVTAVKDWIVEKFNEVVAFFQALPATLSAAASAVWNALKSGLEAAVNWIIRQIDRALGPVDELLGKLASIPNLSATGTRGLDGVKDAARRFNVGERALGGPVSGGMPYIVGERGPELFVPGGSGSIVPNNRLGGGGATYVTKVYVQGSVLSERDLVATINRNQAKGIR